VPEELSEDALEPSVVEDSPVDPLPVLSLPVLSLPVLSLSLLPLLSLLVDVDPVDPSELELELELELVDVPLLSLVVVDPSALVEPSAPALVLVSSAVVPPYVVDGEPDAS
jgi:hypothetical protein